MEIRKNFGVYLACFLLISLIPSQLESYGNNANKEYPPGRKNGIRGEHAGLTYAALAVKEGNHGANSEFWNEVGTNYDAILQGARDEDNLLTPIEHFYNVSTEKGLWGIFRSSLERAEELFNQAIWCYQNNQITPAYEYLGHTLHLLQDATSPAHVIDTQHLFGDPYESYVRDNWNRWIAEWIKV